MNETNVGHTSPLWMNMSKHPKVQDFTVSKAKLEAGLSVKNDMIERLMAENRRQYGEPAT